MGHRQKTGILLEAPNGIRVSLAGNRRVTYTGRSAFPVSDLAPGALADMLSPPAEEQQTPGPTRVIMPVDECENFLRLCPPPSSGGAERIKDETTRWLEEEYGIEPEEQEVFTCPYQVKQKLAVAVTVADKGRMAQYQEALMAAGLRDVVLVSPLDALISLFFSVSASEQAASRAFVHIGQHDSLVLLARERMPVFFRSFRREVHGQSGEDDRYGRFSAEGLPDIRPDQASVDALSEEFKRTLQSYSLVADDDFSVEEVVLTGVGVDVRSMSRSFQTATGIAVVSPPVPKQLVVPSDDSDESTAFRQEWPQLALPAVLAMQRQVKPQARLAVAPSRASQFLGGKGAAIALFLLWLLIAIILLLLLSSQLSRLRGRQIKLQQTQSDMSRQISLRKEMQARRLEYIAATKVLLRMKVQGTHAARLLATANNTRPAEVSFTGVDLTFTETEATLGVGGQFEGIVSKDALACANGYVTLLRETGFFHTVFLEKPFLTPKTVVDPVPEERLWGPGLGTLDGPRLGGGSLLGPWNREHFRYDRDLYAYNRDGYNRNRRNLLAAPGPQPRREQRHRDRERVRHVEGSVKSSMKTMKRD
ncbi:MAG: hypothetical protein HN742_36085 [Lentisphaerae bacterium]|jgi:hypothetical protein|nr:hypothetical protein [Lentisphaerota bacterium]MBT4821138.1 hypothetical protein [Lentisphaerota bacterium]MBT5605093.1 hypothetical protein [Lentisphaerota bacterium]MBT7060657.1 hypothetical protein [Lentisphaerota bacterium]MBT7847346.1 hypothetical protein [Lentisphaerota bacterium]